MSNNFPYTEQKESKFSGITAISLAHDKDSVDIIPENISHKLV